MARSSSEFDLFAFWTPELIEETICDATAAELPSTGYTSIVPTCGVEWPAKFSTSVLEAGKDFDVTTFPYHSIGRLFVYGLNTSIDSNGQKIVEPAKKESTAFYIGNSELLTVAHVFSLQSGGVSFRETHGGFFVPAMINKRDGVGQNYGLYLFYPGDYECHPSYDPNYDQTHDPNHDPNHDIKGEAMALYDVCRVHVVKGIKGGQVVDSIEDANLQPLTVHMNYCMENSDSNTILGAFGHPCQHVQEKQIGVLGLLDSCNAAEVKMRTKAEVLEGMSGGPWMLDSDQGTVVGVQAWKTRDPKGAHFAFSAYLSSDFLEN